MLYEVDRYQGRAGNENRLGRIYVEADSAAEAIREVTRDPVWPIESIGEFASASNPDTSDSYSDCYTAEPYPPEGFAEAPRHEHMEQEGDNNICQPIHQVL